MPIVISLVVLVVLLVKMTRNPQIGLYLVILTTIFTNGIPRGMIFPVVKINELALVLLAVIYGFHFLTRKGQLRRPIKYTQVDVVFIIFVFFSFVIPCMEMLIQGEVNSLNDVLKIILGPFKLYLVYWLVIRIVQTEQTTDTLLRLILLSSALVSMIAIFQVMDLFGVRDILNTYYNESGVDYFSLGMRATSIFNPSWNTLGAYMMLNIVLGFGYINHRRLASLSTWPFIIIVGLDVLGLILSGSLSSLIGTTLGIGGLLFIADIPVSRKRMILLVSVISIGIAFFSFQDFVLVRLARQFNSGGSVLPNSLAQRIDLWITQMWPLARDNMLLGIGPGSLLELTSHNVEESYYFYLLLRGGILTLLSYLLLMVTIIAKIYAIMHRSKDKWYRYIAETALIALVVILIQNISGEYFKYTGVGESLIILVALTIGQSQVRKRVEERA